MNTLVTTNLIDCNRLLSEEVIGGNNTESSIFTNRLTAPITLDVGDKISLHSAYINQRGAGGDVIEFTGREQEDVTSFVNTSIILSEPLPNIQPYAHQRANVSDITETKTLKDNEAYVTFNYYKTSNGENYFFLPRKFLVEHQDTSDADLYIQNWLFVDQLNSGMCYSNVSNIDRVAMGDYINASYQLSNGTSFQALKPKNDNSKFTIFLKKTNQFESISGASFTSVNDPANNYFIKYKETKILSVNAGFDTPSNIASNLTNQLKNILPQNNNNIITPEIGTIYDNEIELYPNIESETYKFFTAANEKSVRRNNYTSYFHSVITPTSTLPYTEDDAIEYDNSYMSIGVKRPEIFDSGRLVRNTNDLPTQNPWEHSWQVKIEIDISASNQPILVTDQKFVVSVGNYQMSDQLSDLSNLFQTQEYYPELFDYMSDLNVSVNNSRFIHINAKQLVGGSVLGSDNYMTTNSTSLTDFRSFPLFIKYDKSQENNGLNVNNGADRENFSDLINGFGIRYRHTDGIDYLAFKISNTLRPEMFNASSKLPADQLLGWDWHFNAYSTLCISLFTGYMELQMEKIAQTAQYLDFYEQSSSKIIDTSRLVRQIYLGCYDPLIKFNDIEERFSISRLHTPEFTGNFFDSGFTNDLKEIDVPVIQGGDEVYKINKYISGFNFSPNMKPYEMNLFTYNNDKFRIINRNIERSKIFDSQCGLYIDNTNLSSNQWSKSLLNVLGFTYEQFNEKNLKINTQTRFTNTKFNSQISTTNALVNSFNIIDFTRNVFGGKMYNIQPSLSQIPAYDPVGKLTFDLPPNIEEVCNSTEIFALNLPKKMSSSHYIIRSSILNQSNYSNSITQCPIIGIVPRSNQFGDYYVTEEDQIEFTVTQKRTISDIQTQIVNPSGILTNCDKESSIIYKLTKFINLNLNLENNNN